VQVAIASVSLLVVYICHHLVPDVAHHLHVLGSAADVGKREVERVLGEIKLLVGLEQTGRSEMPLEDSHLPREESSFVLCLRLPVSEDQDGLQVAIGGCVVEERVKGGVSLVQPTPVFYETDQTVVVVVADGDHGRCFLELVSGGVGQYLLLENEVHNCSVTCPGQQVEEVALVAGERPQVDVGVVDQQLDTLLVVAEYGVVQGSVSFLAFEVDVVGVTHLLQYVLHVVEHALVAGQHQGGHLSAVLVSQISPVLNKDAQVLAGGGEGGVVNGSAVETVLDVDDICEYLEKFA
jgi:hypothetical protein